MGGAELGWQLQTRAAVLFELDLFEAAEILVVLNFPIRPTLESKGGSVSGSH